MKIRGRNKPPGFTHWLLARLSCYDERYASLGDFEEEFARRCAQRGRLYASCWYRLQVLASLFPYIMLVFYWRVVMFNNYLKVAVRNLWKQKGYSLINIIGLAAGITCCIFIFLYLQFETGYDSYHPDAERIYRVAKSRRTGAKHDMLAANVTEVAPTLKERFPEVETAARAGQSHNRYIKVADKAYIKDIVYMADPELFDILGISFSAGDKGSALASPDGMVLTRHIAEKYFGDDNPLGKTVMLDSMAYQVTALIDDIPANTHLKFDMLTRFDYGESSPHYSPWGGWHCMNYVKLVEGTDVAEFQNKIRFLPHEYIGEQLAQEATEYTLILQPIKNIHLHSHLSWEAEAPGNPLYVRIFMAVGIFILLISCMNFINLSTARSANRAAEVGMRKVVGAQRRQLIGQFLGESTLLACTALAGALGVVYFLLPKFNALVGSRYTPSALCDVKMALTLLALILCIGIVAGSYPAFLLSSFRPTAVFRGPLSAGPRGAVLRRVLVVGQFSISITLLIATLLFSQQLSYMKNKYLGFDKEQKLVLEFDRSLITLENYQSVKREFSAHHALHGATFSSSVPGRWMYFWRMWPHGERNSNSQLVNCFQVDYDFFREYDIELVAGRDFSSEMGGDAPGGAYIINQAAVEAFGWQTPEEALTECISDENNPVTGVAKDFHFRGVQSPIEPVVIFLMVEDFRYLTLTVDTAQLNDILAFIDRTYQQLFPNTMYEYFFLDKDLDLQYRAEEKVGAIFNTFAFFGIFIACLGLLGLASFIATQRTREIGIRKVLGASEMRIVVMLSTEFVKWVLVANLIAWPLAWICMRHWLGDFAYRIDITLPPFIVSALLALCISALTVSFQTIRAARINPVRSLNHE